MNNFKKETVRITFTKKRVGRLRITISTKTESLPWRVDLELKSVRSDSEICDTSTGK